MGGLSFSEEWMGAGWGEGEEEEDRKGELWVVRKMNKIILNKKC